MGFVTGKIPCPPEYLLDNDGKPTAILNPEYDLWIQQDQMILGTITNSVTTLILGTIARKPTTTEAWQALEKRFACTSQHRVQQLMATLYKTTRGESSISEFLDRINQVANLLAVVDQPIPETQLVMIIPKFEMTVSAAQARETPIGYDDLSALLLNAENRMNEAEADHPSPIALFGSKS